MEHAYGQLSVHGKEGERFSLDVELKSRGTSRFRLNSEFSSPCLLSMLEVLTMPGMADSPQVRDKLP